MATRRPRLLVVEDDPDQRFLYVQFLGREGFEVLTAPTVGAARDAVAEGPPDAILLDLSLADGGSLEFMDWVRASEPTRHVPIVVVSGSSPADPRLRNASSGWDHFLQKPADLVGLAELLRKETGIA